MLSKAVAGKIVHAVASDPRCQKAIQPLPQADVLAPVADLALRFTHTAGAVRNAAMLLQGKGPGDPEFDQKICLGIVAVTVKAIMDAVRARRIPEVLSVSGTHRVHWGVHHEATWVRMADDTEYVFDWHATLKVRDPAISKADDWLQARRAINFVLFQGFA